MAVLRTNISPPRVAPAASGEAPKNIVRMITYAGIFALAVGGVNYFARSMSARQVTAGPDSTYDAERLFNEALQCMESKEAGQLPTEDDYKMAIKNLTSVLAITSSPSKLHAKILVQRGPALMAIDEYESAIADFSCFLELYRNDPSCAGMLLNRAHCYGQLGKFHDALKDLQTAESCTSDNQLRMMIFFSRGCHYQDQCDCEAAIKDFKQALLCNPSGDMQADILQRLGFCASEEHFYDDAIAYLSSSLRCSDINRSVRVESLYLRATVYMKVDQPKEALADLQLALNYQPSDETRNDILQLIHEIQGSVPNKLG